jgi:hypothetical protein
MILSVDEYKDSIDPIRTRSTSSDVESSLSATYCFFYNDAHPLILACFILTLMYCSFIHYISHDTAHGGAR